MVMSAIGNTTFKPQVQFGLKLALPPQEDSSTNGLQQVVEGLVRLLQKTERPFRDVVSLDKKTGRRNSHYEAICLPSAAGVPWGPKIITQVPTKFLPSEAAQIGSDIGVALDPSYAAPSSAIKVGLVTRGDTVDFLHQFYKDENLPVLVVTSQEGFTSPYDQNPFLRVGDTSRPGVLQGVLTGEDVAEAERVFRDGNLKDVKGRTETLLQWLRQKD